MATDSGYILHLIHNYRVGNIGFGIRKRPGNVIGNQPAQIAGMFTPLPLCGGSSFNRSLTAYTPERMGCNKPPLPTTASIIDRSISALQLSQDRFLPVLILFAYVLEFPQFFRRMPDIFQKNNPVVQVHGNFGRCRARIDGQNLFVRHGTSV
jgi:hypothetical protein